LKTCEDLEKTLNEDSRGLIRHYKERNYVLKSQDILYGRKHPKDKETGVYAQQNNTYVPRTCTMRPGHGKDTHAPQHVPRACWERAITYLFSGISHFLAQTQLKTGI